MRIYIYAAQIYHRNPTTAKCFTKNCESMFDNGKQRNTSMDPGMRTNAKKPKGLEMRGGRGGLV